MVAQGVYHGSGSNFWPGEGREIHKELGPNWHQELGRAFEQILALLAMLTGVKVNGKSIWLWVQERGKMAMEQLEEQLVALEAGELSEMELKDMT